MSHFDTLIGAELSHQPITFTSKVSIFPEHSASLLGMLGGIRRACKAAKLTLDMKMQKSERKKEREVREISVCIFSIDFFLAPQNQ